MTLNGHFSRPAETDPYALKMLIGDFETFCIVFYTHRIDKATQIGSKFKCALGKICKISKINFCEYSFFEIWFLCVFFFNLVATLHG